ncbi:MAG: PDZ domain-containing protein [Candidatus Obscuribacterales bacterium]|nr:PDZ domain-containing protein [Candidatus Obscuribacterales bacterium]
MKSGRQEYGYYRYATVHENRIIFVCEDDLWEVGTTGGAARRLSVGRSEFSMPRFSPDGSLVALVAREEGHQEVFVMQASGGAATRVTYLGSDILNVTGWSPDGKYIHFASDARSPFFREADGYRVSPDGGEPERFKWGHVQSFMFGGNGKTVVVGRNAIDPARWKRYRGGTAGDLWIDPSGKGEFRRLIQLKGNLVCPMIVGDRVYFLSDHEGMGNIYSCLFDGKDLRQHTHHKQYYVRFPSTDGKKIVYTCGSDVYLFDCRTGSNTRIDIKTPASTHQVQRKFSDGREYLEHFSPHPDGHSVALIARGQPITMGNWEGPPTQHGLGSGVRYRMSEWLPDGKRFAVVSDQDGFEKIEIHHADQSKKAESISSQEFGRALSMRVAPTGDKIAVSNHRHELLILDVKTKKMRVIDRSPADRITEFNWSPDGKWLAYSFSPHPQSFHIKIADVQDGSVHNVTDEIRCDTSPAFDPEGKYLYFLGVREFYPVFDSVRFDYGFPKAMKPYLVTLRKDIPSPFVLEPKPIVTKKKKTNEFSTETQGKNGSESSDAHAVKAHDKQHLKQVYKDALTKAYKEVLKTVEIDAPPVAAPAGKAASTVRIDFDGIADRIVGFPVAEGRYGQILGADNRALFTVFPVEGIKPNFSWYLDDHVTGTLQAYDFEEARSATLQKEVGQIRLAFDNQTMFYRSHRRLRAVDALEKLAADGREPATGSGQGRKSGFLDLSRAQVLVTPQAEWKQMYEESWRLQREQFWDEKMSDIDWNLVRERYGELLPRVRTRSEVSDLIWEMQGELGTSHAYELGGDHRRAPSYHLGFLGCDLVFDKRSNGYRIEKVLAGDSWNRETVAPIARPGLNVNVGDFILKVNGAAVDRQTSVSQLLLNQSGKEVRLKILSGKNERDVVVETLWSERSLRYRDWVKGRREYVRSKSRGKVGYIHIPDMGPWGFAEFHRSYLSEINCDGLIIDVRYNRGGHVSPLLLEKLLRKRVGYDISRWGPPQPYPPESVRGPLVAVTNQFAGSDGDIFSHCFKIYNLGPLVGKRTWGGVIGIWPRHRLVDGTITTQPEFSFWFQDVGWSVENYGTDPDYDVDIAPHDFIEAKDPQLDKALELVLKDLRDKPLALPDFSIRPSLPVPEQLLLGKSKKIGGKSATRKSKKSNQDAKPVAQSARSKKTKAKVEKKSVARTRTKSTGKRTGSRSRG